jgi:hypothetical protein
MDDKVRDITFAIKLMLYLHTIGLYIIITMRRMEWYKTKKPGRTICIKLAYEHKQQ